MLPIRSTRLRPPGFCLGHLNNRHRDSRGGGYTFITRFGRRRPSWTADKTLWAVELRVEIEVATFRRT